MNHWWRTGVSAGAAIVAAGLSSACCWLPLVLIAGGVSAGGTGLFFAQFRFWFLGASGIALASGFYWTYFRQPKCEPGSECEATHAKSRRVRRATLWIATGAVIGMAFLPPSLIANAVSGQPPTETDTHEFDGQQIRVAIEGMTCEGCAATVCKTLETLDAVRAARVDYEAGTATVDLAAGASFDEAELIGAIKKLGFTARLGTPSD